MQLIHPAQPGIHDFASAEQVAAVRRPLNQAALLPASFYADARSHAFDVEKLFMRHWLPVAHVSELAEPGSYLSREMFGEPILLTCDKEGTIHAFSNVCRHRNRVIVDGKGVCKGTLTCPYHGWSYGLDGSLKGAPFMQQAENFDKLDYHLPRLGLDIWQGFVFINFDVEAPLLSPQLKTLDKVLDPLKMAEMACMDFDRYQAPWNWKATLDNFTEAYHQPTIHAGIDPLVPGRTAVYDDVDGPYNLFWIPAAPGASFQPVLPEMQDAIFDGLVVVNVFPLFHLLIDPSAIMWLDWDIRGVNDHDLIWCMLVPNASTQIDDFDAKKQELYGYVKQVWDEDVFACAGVAKGASSRFTAQGRLCPQEKSLYQLHNWLIDQYER